jgi:HK97 family phage portal protein
VTIASALFRRPEQRLISDQQFLGAFARGDDFSTGVPTPAGVTVTRSSALGLSSVWACVSLISDSVATLPVGIYTRDAKGVRAPYKTTPRWVDTPNPEQTRVDFIFGQIASLLLDGTAFVYTVRDRKGDVGEAWVLDPSMIIVRREYDRTGALGIVYYVGVAEGQQSPIGAPNVYRVPAGSEMFHVTGFTSSSASPRGLAPLEIARMMYGGGIASQEMAARFFGSGMNAAGVIEVDGDLHDNQAKQLKDDFKRRNAGLKNMHLPPVLTGGAKFKQLTISPEQSQFLQQREFTVQEIARWFRIPPHMIGQIDRSTSWGTGIEFQNMQFLSYTLRPWIERLEAAWTRWMLIFEKGARVEFDVAGLLRGDHATRAAYYQARFATGSMSPSEIRVAEGEAPLDGGDVYYYPANMVPVGEQLSVLEQDAVAATPAKAA